MWDLPPSASLRTTSRTESISSAPSALLASVAVIGLCGAKNPFKEAGCTMIQFRVDLSPWPRCSDLNQRQKRPRNDQDPPVPAALVSGHPTLGPVVAGS